MFKNVGTKSEDFRFFRVFIYINQNVFISLVNIVNSGGGAKMTNSSIIDVAMEAAPTSFRGVLKVIMGIRDPYHRRDCLEVLANRGHAESQVALAEEYIYRDGLPNRYASWYWFSKAAENGSLDGKYNVAKYHYWGFYVDRNRELAFELYKETAGLGHTDSQIALAEC
jgi:hypothetical protein